MLTVSRAETFGWEAAIRGMRNPKNSWNKSDSFFINGELSIGPNDMGLMHRLFRAGTEHRKFLQMIHIQMDVTGPLYWWKEADTYRFVVKNSCSTMHKITAKPLSLSDFSAEHLTTESRNILISSIATMNAYRDLCIENPRDKSAWWQIIQLLPTSYNQKRTLDFNYETAVNIIRQRSGHKLDEWHQFVTALRKLPYMEAILEEAE